MQLERNEQEVLFEILNREVEQLVETKDRMIEDDVTLNSWDTFVEVVQSHQIRTELVEGIRDKLIEEMTRDNEDGHRTA